MSDPARRGPLQWTVAVPVVSLLLLLATWTSHGNPVVLVLIVQVSALTVCVANHRGTESVVLAVIAGRLTVLWSCLHGTPAARPDSPRRDTIQSADGLPDRRRLRWSTPAESSRGNV